MTLCLCGLISYGKTNQLVQVRSACELLPTRRQDDSLLRHPSGDSLRDWTVCWIFCRTYGFSTGRVVSNPVHPCAGGLDGNVSVRADGGVRRNWLGIQCAPRIDDGDCYCDDRRNLYFHRARDRIALGPAGVGRLVGLGCPADFNSDLGVSLHWIYFAAIID